MSNLIKYEAACAALAECKAIDEVKAWADKAAAMQAYGRMAKDRTLEVDAAEIRIRAERRLGEMLTAAKADGGLNKGVTLAGNKADAGQGSPAVVADDRRPKLADAGISKDLSSRAQKLAAVPAAEFEAELAAKRERDRKDGARVSARLEASGERHLKKSTQEVERDRLAEEAFGDVDPLAELEAAHAEVRLLTEHIAAMSADDAKAETLKWRRMYDAAVREQSKYMDLCDQAKKREAWNARQLARCGKAIGQADPEKIAAAVEAFVRSNSKVAA